MGIINQLDFQVANLIAAGEVVDRPASACKELIENAIDAGATKITIEIKAGGSSLIRVSDNGKGMSREDVPLSIKRHATSKIKNAGDLVGIATLGFRGEALAAISSVAKMRIFTKREEDSFGTLMVSEPGKEPTLSEIGYSNGTCVVAENLFENMPARRKFLKKDSTEAMAVTAAVEKMALSHPEISFVLISDGVQKLSTTGDGKLKNTIYQVMGRDFATKLIEINYTSDLIKIHGYIGTPENVRVNRNFQNFFVNNRFVKSKCAAAALEQAFTSYFPAEKFPTCVLFIEILPELVDVNVHPAKLEVKFADERAVFEAVYYAVRGALEQSIPRPEINKSDNFNNTANNILNAFVPIDDRQKSTAKPVYMNQKNVKVGQVSIKDILKGGEKASPANSSADSGNVKYDEYSRFPEKAFQPGHMPSNFSKNNLNEIDLSGEKMNQNSVGKTDNEVEKPPVRFEYPIENIPLGSKPTYVKNDKTAASGIPQPNAILSQEKDSVSGKRGLAVENLTPPEKRVEAPEYKIIGEVFYSYVIVEVGDKMMIIDKHAAHERILFEEMKRALVFSEVCSQLLLCPIEIDMTPSELAAIEDYEDEIKALGIDYTTKEGKKLMLTAIPNQLTPSAAADMMVTIADRISDGTGSARITRELIFEKALYQASCKAAVKIGRMDKPEDIDWIVKNLLMFEDIKYCPHGRPVAFDFTKSNLENMFKRT